MQNNFIKNMFFLFFPIFLGSIVGLIISSSIDYDLLIKPLLSPPGYIFPIVWSIIYILLGLSYYLFKTKEDNEEISKTYYLGLFVNLLWSIFFFVLKWRFFTIIWTILLLILVIKLFILYLKNNELSAYLNIPYLLWLVFATYLTIGVYILN